MTNDAKSGALPPDAEPDLGEPVAELRDLTLDVGEEFVPRVRRRIERRRLAGEFVGLAFTAPLTILLELLRAPFEWLAGKRRA